MKTISSLSTACWTELYLLGLGGFMCEMAEIHKPVGGDPL